LQAFDEKAIQADFVSVENFRSVVFQRNLIILKRLQTFKPNPARFDIFFPLKYLHHFRVFLITIILILKS